MHLLRVITSMNPIYGGPPQGIRHVTHALQNRGIKTTVVCLDVPGSTFLEKDTFPIVALGPTYTQVAYSKKIESYLFKHILEFDLVIIHGLWHSRRQTGVVNDVIKALQHIQLHRAHCVQQSN